MNRFLFNFRLAVWCRLVRDCAHASTVGYNMFRLHTQRDESWVAGEHMCEMAQYVRELESAVQHWSDRVDAMMPDV